MSVENLYAKLAEQADNTPFQDFPGVCRKARRRRTKQILTGVTAAALTAAIVVSGQFLLRKDSAPDKLPPTVNTTHIAHPATRFGMTAMDLNRLYTLMHQEDGSLKVSATDLITGKPAWPTLDLGKFGDTMGIFAAYDGLYAIGEHDGTGVQDPYDYVLHAIDPATGKVTLRLPFDFNSMDWEVLPGAVILADPEKDVTQYYSSTTGKLLRTTTEAIQRGGTTIVLDSSLPPVHSGMFPRPMIGSPYLAQNINGNEILTRKAPDGSDIAIEHGGPLTESERLFMIDGFAYAYDAQGERRLTQGGTQKVNRTELVGPLRVCGVERICLIERKKPNEVDLVMLDAKEHKEVWRQRVPEGVEEVAPSARGLLVANSGGMQVYDLSGKLILSKPDVHVASWLNPDTVLAFRQSGEETSLWTVGLDGTEFELAKLKIRGYCAWNWSLGKIACPTADGVTVVNVTG